ncbi:MAG: dynamin family protein [Chloroflexi bacterium]|nr:dynamin family protein [Chloroflexota bacterium]
MVQMTPVGTGALEALREQTIHLLTDIAAALSGLNDGAQADRTRLQDMASDLREAFFLVAIIGEFNAGKSTFINALLGEPLLPMGITPTTEAIELVRYGSQAVRVPTVRQDSSTREWSHPNTGGPGVALVDTPGTGSVFQRHETTAKSFLHRSDLVIFVLSAKRALADAERLYLDLAMQYGKKIILVVNQIDLLDPNERETVRRFIEQQVKQHLNLAPLIFMVSAKDALAGADGGMGAVKAHLRGVLAQTPPAQQKLLAQLDTAAQVVRRYVRQLEDKYDAVSADSTRAKTIRSELEQQSISLADPLKSARLEIDKVFLALRERGMAFIDANLNVRLFGGAPSKERLQTEFHDQVLGRASRDISDAASAYVNALVDNSRVYWRGVIDRLNRLKDVLEGEVVGFDATTYAQQREGLDEAIRIAETELKSYESGQVIGDMHRLFESNLSGLRNSLLSAFGGLVVLLLGLAGGALPGGVAAAPLAIPAVIAGAVLALPGSLLMIRYLRRIAVETKQDFNHRIDRLQKTYHAALDDLTSKERSRLAQYGMQVLTPIFSRLETIATQSKERLEKFRTFDQRIVVLKSTVEAESAP